MHHEWLKVPVLEMQAIRLEMQVIRLLQVINNQIGNGKMLLLKFSGTEGEWNKLWAPSRPTELESTCWRDKCFIDTLQSEKHTENIHTWILA